MLDDDAAHQKSQENSRNSHHTQNNHSDSVVRLMKSPAILVRAAALILALLTFLAPMVSITPDEIYSVYGTRSLEYALSVNAYDVSIVDYVQRALPNGIAQGAVFLAIVFPAFFLVGLVLSLVPKVAHYARLLDLVAAIVGGLVSLAALFALGAIPDTIRTFVKMNIIGGSTQHHIDQLRELAVFPAFGIFCLLVATMLAIGLLVSVYIFKPGTED